MTRQIRIVHHTGYSYAENVLGSHNEVRMTPRSNREQWVINSRIDIQPNPWVLNYTDYWGTRVTAFEIRERHSRLGVTSTATVEVTRPPEVAPGVTWDELRDMSRRGIEIGSHTANHDPLTSMDAARQLDEVHLSKLLLEWNGIHTVYTFSYPNGAYDASLPALLAQNEYLTAVTGDAGLNTFETDPYLMQRVNIPHPRFGLLEFKLRLLKAEIFTKLRIHQHLENPS